MEVSLALMGFAQIANEIIISQVPVTFFRMANHGLVEATLNIESSMRNAKERREAIRRRIIEAALELFCEHGIEGTCLKRITAVSGVKHGSLFYYFESKEQIVREAFILALKKAFDSWKSVVAEDGSGFGGELMRYLSISHRNNCAGGCALAALAPEMGRQSEATRTEIEKGLNQIFQMFNERLPIRRLQPCRTQAIAIYSLMIGALQLSRTVSSTEMSEEILKSGVEAALLVIDWGIIDDSLNRNFSPLSKAFVNASGGEVSESSSP